MSPAHFLLLVRAESNKLLSRGVARFTLLICCLVGLAGPAFLGWLATSEVIWNGAPLSALLTRDAATGAQWALELRNFFVMRTLIAAAAALMLAGELQSRTLREDLLRPVTRSAVLAARWLALCLWIAIGLGMQWLVATTLGVAAFGFTSTWGDSIVLYLASGLTDAVFAAMVLAIAALTRNVAATVAGTILAYVLAVIAGWALSILGVLPDSIPMPEQLRALAEAQIWLPPAALAAWRQALPSGELVWQSWAGLLGLLLASAALALWRFYRTEVP